VRSSSSRKRLRALLNAYTRERRSLPLSAHDEILPYWDAPPGREGAFIPSLRLEPRRPVAGCRDGKYLRLRRTVRAQLKKLTDSQRETMNRIDSRFSSPHSSCGGGAMAERKPPTGLAIQKAPADALLTRQEGLLAPPTVNLSASPYVRKHRSPSRSASGHN